MTAEQTWGSDSPHAKNARDRLARPSFHGLTDPTAITVTHAILAVADELAEGNRQRNAAEAIPRQSAISAPEHWAPEGIIPNLPRWGRVIAWAAIITVLMAPDVFIIAFLGAVTS